MTSGTGKPKSLSASAGSIVGCVASTVVTVRALPSRSRPRATGVPGAVRATRRWKAPMSSSFSASTGSFGSIGSKHPVSDSRVGNSSTGGASAGGSTRYTFPFIAIM